MEETLAPLEIEVFEPCAAVRGYNHITSSGFSYDSAGNNTADAQWSYTFDAENRITKASGMSGGPYCYAYDGDGMRVAKAHKSGGQCTDTNPYPALGCSYRWFLGTLLLTRCCLAGSFWRSRFRSGGWSRF